MTENIVLSQMAGNEGNGREADAADDAKEPDGAKVPDDAAKVADEPLPVPDPPPVSYFALDFDDEIRYADILDEDPETVPEAVAGPEPEPMTEAVAEAEPDAVAEPMTEPEQAAEPGEMITIRVNSGDDSFRVCSRLEIAGLVAVASEYNQYLMDNGYSRSLRVGDHNIPQDADYRTIALILTGR
jgi:hypothetical protein